ncbi:hypothetical protein [Labilibaculum manganireducens]|nr:hypothetical protein [Labilibaculum manganireducens]
MNQSHGRLATFWTALKPHAQGDRFFKDMFGIVSARVRYGLAKGVVHL